MPRNYVPIFVFLLVAFAVAAGTLLVAALVRPRNPGKVKGMAYECGIEAMDSARHRYTVRFYIIAILFVVFDVETIFLFPWAVQFKNVGHLASWKCWSSSESWCSAMCGYGRRARCSGFRPAQL